LRAGDAKTRARAAMRVGAITLLASGLLFLLVLTQRAITGR